VEYGIYTIILVIRYTTGREQAIKLIEGLALQTPQRSAAAIHRQMTARTTLESRTQSPEGDGLV
jgi:hypothetical protein